MLEDYPSAEKKALGLHLAVINSNVLIIIFLFLIELALIT
jgi:hypothetical protein